MTPRNARGFSMIELMAVLIVFGIVMAFSVPTYQNYTASQNLTGAADNIAGQLRMAREKAIGVGQTQTIHFTQNFPTTADYHVHNGSVITPQWELGKNITYYYGIGFGSEYRFTKDGRCMDSGLVILQDHRGRRDTVSVQRSGLITRR